MSPPAVHNVTFKSEQMLSFNQHTNGDGDIFDLAGGAHAAAFGILLSLSSGQDFEAKQNLIQFLSIMPDVSIASHGGSKAPNRSMAEYACRCLLFGNVHLPGCEPKEVNPRTWQLVRSFARCF